MVALLVIGGIEAALAVLLYRLGGRSPHTAALWLLLITAPLELYRTTIAGVNLSLFRVSIGIGIVVLAYEWRRARRLPIPRWRGTWVVVAVYLAGAALVALSLAVNPADTTAGGRLLAQILLGATAIAVIVLLAREVPMASLAEGFALSSLLPVLAGAWQTLGIRLGWNPLLPLLDLLPLRGELTKSRESAAALGDLGDRAKGTFADPNHFGAFLSLTLAVAAGLLLRALLRRETNAAVGYGALCVAIGSTLIASYSRSAWLGATIALIALLALAVPAARARLSRRRLLLTAAVVVGSCAVAAAPVAPKVAARLDSTEATNQISDEVHSKTIRAGLDAFGDNPLFGIGVGGIGLRLDQGGGTSGTHSSYVTVAAELGTPGVLVLLTAAILVLVHLWRMALAALGRPRGVLVGSLLAGYVGFLVTNALYDLWWDDFHFAFLGVALALTSPAPCGRSPAAFRSGRGRAGR